MKANDLEKNKKISVLNLGCSNIFSITTSLIRLGLEVEIVDKPAEVASAQRLLVPGVGSFAEGVKQLDKKELRTPLRERIMKNLPTAAICLGMQLMFRGSKESPGYEGLGIFDEILEQTNPGKVYPNFGWEVVGDPKKCSYMYFAHSYCARAVPEEWNPIWTTGSSNFVAQLSKGQILACQFHPEISGNAGEQFLKTWIRNTEYEQ